MNAIQNKKLNINMPVVQHLHLIHFLLMKMEEKMKKKKFP